MIHGVEQVLSGMSKYLHGVCLPFYTQCSGGRCVFWQLGRSILRISGYISSFLKSFKRQHIQCGGDPSASFSTSSYLFRQYKQQQQQQQQQQKHQHDRFNIWYYIVYVCLVMVSFAFMFGW